MAVTFISGSVKGSIKAPPSKSAMQRALLAALLARGTSVISNPSYCDDSVAATDMIRLLGATVTGEGERVVVKGGLNPGASLLNCGESGLALRMFTPVAAMTGERLVLEGKGSLRKRPVEMIEKPLASMGAEVKTDGGLLPIEVKGPLAGGAVDVDGSVSSQFLTGLLFALPLAANDSLIRLKNATSRPYIDMTIEILSRFGVYVENHGYSEFIVPGNQLYKPASIEIEGDWSGASFFLVMGAIGGEITVSGLRHDSLQADRKVADVLRLAGAVVTSDTDGVTVRKGELKPFTFNIDDCPDLAPPLSVLAAACKGRTVLTGTSRLHAKESSRGENIITNLARIGSTARLGDNWIEIEGSGLLRHSLTGSFGDHRMAMAMAAASVLSPEGITVDDTRCINKSYPGFLSDFVRTGGNVLLT